MVLGHLDLNLLRPLLALLDEKSVTRAAERLRISQPTASIALSRLRKHFGDPLLVRQGAAYELTPLGDRLHRSLPMVLGSVDRFLSLDAVFDPTESRHEFVISAVDYAAERIGAPLARRIARVAPNVQLSFATLRSELVRGAPESLRAVDGVILPHGYLLDQPHLDLAVDTWVCIADARSGLSPVPTAAELLSRPWVNTLDAREGLTPARQQLRLQGVEVNVTAITPDFHVVPSFVLGTDRVALMPATLATRLAAADHSIQVLASPFGLELIRDAFWWHSERENQPEHRWLRTILTEVADELAGPTTIANSHEVD